MIAARLLLLLVGHAIYRVRGGFLPTGSTQIARAIWCAPLGLLAWHTTSDPTLGALTAIGAYLGLMWPHGRQMDMGRWHDSWHDDFMLMWAIGWVRLSLVLVPALVLGHATPIAFALATALSVLHPVSYEIGWRLPVPKGWLDDHKKIIDAPTAWGELIWGGPHMLIVHFALSGLAF